MKKYLDFCAGIAVLSLGHAHPKLINSIKKQSKNFGMCPMLLRSQKEKISKKTVSKTFATMLYFKIVVLRLLKQLLKLQEDIFFQ